MSVTKDPASPMYVPEENRLIARERAKKHVEMISDYLKARERIEVGLKCHGQYLASKERVLKALGGREDDWNDWKWQLRHAIRDTSTLSKIIRLSAQETEDIEKTATQYRWSSIKMMPDISGDLGSKSPVSFRNSPLRGMASASSAITKVSAAMAAKVSPRFSLSDNPRLPPGPGILIP